MHSFVHKFIISFVHKFIIISTSVLKAKKMFTPYKSKLL